MFDFVREHKKLMQIGLLVVIVPSFVLVSNGLSSDAGAGADTIATVGGSKITQMQLEDAQRNQLENARAQMGERFDPKMFETPEAKRYVLDSLVRDRAIDTEMAKNKMTVGDAMLKKSITDIPVFKKPDGSFNLDEYKALLGARQMSATQFEESLRRDLTKAQIDNAIQGSAFVPRALATRISEISDQEREVQELLFPITEFLPKVAVTDTMVKAYYDKNATLFQVPEQVKVEYVVFDAAVVDALVTVSDADARAFYDKNLKTYTTPEARNVSHILIASGKDASAADKAAAKASAEAVLAEVRAAPASFAAVAKAKSQDRASGELGGDLGLMTKAGDLASPEVEAAAAKLKAGEVSDLVASEFGFHIVTVTSIKPEAVRSFDEAKAEIVAEQKKALMSKKYSELAEQFTDTVYEQSNSLKPVADKLKLTIKTVDQLSRTPNPALGTEPVNNPKFLKAIFSDDALKNKRNTEAVEVAPTTLVAGRVVEYKPATKRPLAEVDALIRERVKMEEALRLAKEAGQAKLTAAKASGDATGFGAPTVVNRGKQPEIQLAAAREVMKADTSKLPAYVGVDVPGVGYGVYRINKVSQPAQPDMVRRAAEREQINSAVAQQERFSYIEALKKKHEVKILKPVAAAPSN